MLFVCFIRFGVGEHFYFVYVFFFLLMIRRPPRSTQSSRRQRQMCIRDRRPAGQGTLPPSDAGKQARPGRQAADTLARRTDRGKRPGASCKRWGQTTFFAPLFLEDDAVAARLLGLVKGLVRLRDYIKACLLYT